MQWFKGAMVVTSAFVLAAMANGCSSKDNGNGDAGDAKSDGLSHPDGKTEGGGGDGGPGCGSGLDCEQCDVTGYSPIQQGTPHTVPNACTAQQLQDFVTACFSTGASSTTCSAWEAQDTGACGTCLQPVLQSTTSWGPFDCETSSSPCGANAGGCVDKVIGQVGQEGITGGSGSCGDLVTVNFGCQDYACSTCSTTDFQTCDQSAVANECASYVSQVSSTTGICAGINGDAAPARISDCFPQSDSDNVNFVDVFCGPNAIQ